MHPNKQALINKTMAEMKLRDAEEVCGGVVAQVLNHAKKGEPKYCLKVFGAKPKFETFDDKGVFLKTLIDKLG